MIPHGVEIFVSLDPVDLRWSFDRLAGVVEERIGRNARCGALFVFFGKRKTAAKILFFDGTGLCIFYKRLDKKTFRLPAPLDEHSSTVVIEEGALDDLLDGLDLERATPRRRKETRLLH